jgi:hypothetical protein
MYLVLHGDLIGVTFVEGEAMPRERLISPGDSINVLCVLKVVRKEMHNIKLALVRLISSLP